MSLSADNIFENTERSRELQKRVREFIEEVIIPGEKIYREQHRSFGENRWQIPPIMEEMKQKAREAGLWNLFLPGELGAGLTNMEYAPIAEIMGAYPLSSEVFNCSAPDSGNMEILARFGTEEQKERWLKPLLEGKIRSGFAMTEPHVASSDATNISASIVRDGNEYVINAHKWWTSGALDPRCEFVILMGKTNPDAPTYEQQSMVIVPLDTPGVKIVRPLTVFGNDHAPHGHAEILFENVRVPVSNILWEEGKGFAIAQSRLGPGRIHHCMRQIGVAERALKLMCERAQVRAPFGKPLSERGVIQEWIAESRIEIEQARLLTLKAAYMMDKVGVKGARKLISMIKVVAPNVTLKVLDRAIQVFGAAGVSQDFPLAGWWTSSRTIRLADGPDEVHKRTIARLELKDHPVQK